MKTILLLVGFGIGLVAGVLFGQLRWGTEVARVTVLEGQIQSLESEVTRLASERAELEHRIQQIGKEQERLFRDNEQLRLHKAAKQIGKQAGADDRP